MNMKTRSYHITNLGSFAPQHIEDVNGYVVYHDSPRAPIRECYGCYLPPQ
jgi:hypothetical protein